MKIQLQKLEATIQDLVEHRLVELFPKGMFAKVAIHELAAALHAQMNDDSGVNIAPNVFTLIIHPDDYRHWQDPIVLDTVRESLLSVGQMTNIIFPTPPTISVATDLSLRPGDLKIIGSNKIDTIEPTNSIPINESEERSEIKIPDNAFLIIDGRKTFPLAEGVINIGRRLDNHLTIDDPRVSRTHAQLRSIDGRFVIFDLNSTGGTFVNGKRTDQTILYPGDVISLAGVNLVYGQDNPLPRLDLKDTGPLIPDPLDRKTVVIKSTSENRLSEP